MATLENRKNGRWQITIPNGYDEAGRQIRVKRTVHIGPKITEKEQQRLAEKETVRIISKLHHRMK